MLIFAFRMNDQHFHLQTNQSAKPAQFINLESSSDSSQFEDVDDEMEKSNFPNQQILEAKSHVLSNFQEAAASGSRNKDEFEVDGFLIIGTPCSDSEQENEPEILPKAVKPAGNYQKPTEGKKRLFANSSSDFATKSEPDSNFKNSTMGPKNCRETCKPPNFTSAPKSKENHRNTVCPPELKYHQTVEQAPFGRTYEPKNVQNLPSMNSVMERTKEPVYNRFQLMKGVNSMGGMANMSTMGSVPSMNQASHMNPAMNVDQMGGLKSGGPPSGVGYINSISQNAEGAPWASGPNYSVHWKQGYPVAAPPSK